MLRTEWTPAPAAHATQQRTEILEDHDDWRVGARQEIHDEWRAGIIQHLPRASQEEARQPLQRLQDQSKDHEFDPHLPAIQLGYRRHSNARPVRNVFEDDPG